jgi:hypothetical protein
LRSDRPKGKSLKGSPAVRGVSYGSTREGVNWNKLFVSSALREQFCGGIRILVKDNLIFRCHVRETLMLMIEQSTFSTDLSAPDHEYEACGRDEQTKNDAEPGPATMPARPWAIGECAGFDNRTAPHEQQCTRSSVDGFEFFDESGPGEGGLLASLQIF